MEEPKELVNGICGEGMVFSNKDSTILYIEFNYFSKLPNIKKSIGTEIILHVQGSNKVYFYKNSLN